eukprot:5877512-Pleurochrysis_carterae.AAC.1
MHVFLSSASKLRPSRHDLNKFSGCTFICHSIINFGRHPSADPASVSGCYSQSPVSPNAQAHLFPSSSMYAHTHTYPTSNYARLSTHVHMKTHAHTESRCTRQT